MALHYLNGDMGAVKKPIAIKKAVNKAFQTSSGIKQLTKFNAGKKMVKIQVAKQKGLINPIIAKKQMQKLAPVLQTEISNKKQNEKLDNAVTDEIVKEYNEIPSPKFIDKEQDNDIKQGVDEVNEPEFNVPSPESETNGADMGYIKGNCYRDIAMSGSFKKVKQTAKKYKINAQKKVTEINKDIAKAKKLNKPKVVKALQNAGKKIVNTAKKTGLAIPRTSFLGMVQLNAFNLANKLTQLSQTSDGKNKLYDVWVNKLGGNWDKLRGAVNTSKSKIWKRTPLKINGITLVPLKPAIGEPTTLATVTALVTAATPILASVTPLFKNAGIDVKDIENAKKLSESGLSEQINTEVNIPKDEILVRKTATSDYCS